MARARTRKISLHEAARTAARTGLLDQDFYSLYHSQLDVLDELLAVTRWRQSRSSASRGHMERYAFHLALQRVRRGPMTTEADELHARARALDEEAQRLWRGGEARASAAAWDVAADAFEEAGDLRAALRSQTLAAAARRRADQLGE